MRNYALLLQNLHLDLKTKEHILTSDMNLSTARCLWLENSFFKKLEDTISLEADSRCLERFKKANQVCQDFAFRPESSFEEIVIGEVKSLFDNFFQRGPDLLLDLSAIAEGFNVGPGASINVESYNFYTKLFDSSLSSTNGQLLQYYRSAISLYPEWRDAEIARHAIHGNDIVVGNRLSFVPKTSEISRSICTEPNLNMLFQKGLGLFLEKALRFRFGINLSTQPDSNRRLARLGSSDGSFGTIDLASASDSMSLNLLRQLIPPSAMRWFELCRSPSVIYPDGTVDELHMISSMGNAFTFPLQTILFASIVVACYRTLGVKPTYDTKGPLNFAVFGDDIIVRNDAYAFVIKALKLFGFSVNESKSFNFGDFRESCGGDFLRGHDIRGVYVKSLKTSADVYSTINRLVRWGARSGIELPNTLSLLLSWAKFLPIPYSDGDAEGIKVPFAPLNLSRDRNTNGIIYNALVKTTFSFKLPDELLKVRRYPFGSKVAISYNPSGLLLSFIGGYIRNGRISLRSEVGRFKVHRRITSSWGATTVAGSTNAEIVRAWISYYEPVREHTRGPRKSLLRLNQDVDWIVYADSVFKGI